MRGPWILGFALVGCGGLVTADAGTDAAPGACTMGTTSTVAPDTACALEGNDQVSGVRSCLVPRVPAHVPLHFEPIEECGRCFGAPRAVGCDVTVACGAHPAIRLTPRLTMCPSSGPCFGACTHEVFPCLVPPLEPGSYEVIVAGKTIGQTVADADGGTLPTSCTP